MEKLLYLTTSLLALSFSQLAAVSDTSLKDWWDGKRGTGAWFGARPALEDRGINLTGRWIGTFYGVAAGGLDQRGAFDQSLLFDLKVDFAKLTGWSALERLTAAAGVRYRDGLNVNNFLGASTTFNPSIKAASNGASCHSTSLTRRRNSLE